MNYLVHVFNKVTLVLISGIYLQHWVGIMVTSSSCAAVRISKANLFFFHLFLFVGG